MDKTTQVSQESIKLRDIHLPSDPSLWPLAPGWWLIIIVSCVIIYFAIKKLIQIRKQKRTIALLKNELLEISNNYKNHNDKHKLSIDISQLLKRFVRHVLNDSNATSLTGDKWIDYLNSKAETELFNQFKIELTQAQYTPNIEFDVTSFIATVNSYFPIALKSHRTNKVNGNA